MSEKRLLGLILALFILLGSSYALVTPIFEASDELWHYPMVRHLADGNPLPVQAFDPALAGPWKQEASQPPLYYYVAAALTFWIDTGDMDQVRWLNPHVDNGVITTDGNINLAVHDPAGNPWQGTRLAVRLVRLASVLMGAVTVTLTYAIARHVAPGRAEIALGAAAVNAFMPMFLFISGAVNNDNLAIMLASLGVLLLIELVRRPRPGRGGLVQILITGGVIGLAALTKEGTLALIPLALGTLFIAQWQARLGETGETGETATTLPAFLRQLLRLLGRSLLAFGLLLIPVLLIAGWWYYRNIQLYGDWLGWNAFIAVLGQRPQPASLAQLWDERWGFLLAYWGLFGGVNVPMATWIYRLLNGVLLLGVLGFPLYLLQEIRARRLAVTGGRTLPGLLAGLLDLVVGYFPLVVSLLFSAAVVYGLISWATTTWSSQGRLVFTAISTLTVLLVVGLVGWLPRRPAGGILAVLSTFLFLVAAAAPWLWIRPAYDPAAYAPPRPYVAQPAAVTFGDTLRLTGYAVLPPDPASSTLRPGDWVDVVLNWQVLAPAGRDWSVFVHLNDPVLGVPIAQRDMYHAQGLRPTSLLTPGESLTTYYRLFVPRTAAAPAQLELAVGLYDFGSEERLPTTAGQEAATLAVLPLQPIPGEFPNATAVNFGAEVLLVGYEVAPRTTRPGEALTLTLYWQPLRPLDTDYTFFAQLLDEDTTRWASADVAPPNGTSRYPAGEVQTLDLPLLVDENTPAGVYPIVIGLYTRTPDGGFQRLQIVVDGRITMEDMLTLTQIRVAR